MANVITGIPLEDASLIIDRYFQVADNYFHNANEAFDQKEYDNLLNNARSDLNALANHLETEIERHRKLIIY